MNSGKAFLTILLLTMSLATYAATFEAGVHYQKLANPIETEAKDGIEVLEVFWYGCPHCYSSQPYIENWQKTKPQDARLVHTPAALGGVWSLHAQVFYTNKAMGIHDKVHKATFDAIHKSKLTLTNVEQVVALYKSQFGVDAEKYKKIFDSFGVQLNLKKAQKKIATAGVSSVPTFIVAGKYMVNAQMAGSTAKIFDVIDYLVEKETKG